MSTTSYSDAVKPWKARTCVDHKAAGERSSGQRNLDITGVMGCACARHGCFIPHSMTDMYKGERFEFLCQHHMSNTEI